MGIFKSPQGDVTEPEKMVVEERYTNYKFLAIMKTIAFMCNSAQKRMRESERRAGISLMEMGYANGYVAISPEHPLWRVHYDNCDIDVWGGLTFSDDACRIQEWDNVEMIDDMKQTDIPQDWWVLGFDTMHYGDGAQHDREWVIAETRRMQQQLEQFGPMEKLKVFAKTVEESADAQIKEMNDCEAFAELGKAVAACGVNDKTVKPKSKKHKKD